MGTRIEQRIAAHFGRAHCVLVGSGTTALYCALAQVRANLDTDDALALYPNVTCETAVNAGIFAGFRPVFCDASTENGLMSAASVSEALTHDGVHAIVPTHIFGHIVDVASLRDAIPPDLPVIEDAAQGYGGTLGASRVGAMAKSSVLSFGAGKLLECGGGGALLCDDPLLAKAYREIASTLHDDPDRASAHRVTLMQAMMSAGKQLRKQRPALIARQREILHEHREGYLSRITSGTAERIETAFDHLGQAIAERVDTAQMLDEALAGIPGLRLPRRSGVPVLWRHTIYVDPADRERCIEVLTAAGIQTSRLFLPCSRKFLADERSFPASESHAGAVVNILYPPTGTSIAAFVTTVARVLRARFEDAARDADASS